MIFLIIRTVAVEIIDRLYVVHRPMGILLPVVFSYGGVELLRVGETFHSRTKKAYASMNGLHKDSICFYEYYLKIPDYRVPKSCKLVDSVWSTVFDVFACLLAGDDEEAKRRKRLEEIRDALPYRMGMKWGLKLGERIIVPPKYRKILPPVGVYCAFEESACRWGVMALDGKVMVEARYQEVDIENNGTVHLTVIPGKVKTVKL